MKENKSFQSLEYQFGQPVINYIESLIITKTIFDQIVFSHIKNDSKEALANDLGNSWFENGVPHVEIKKGLLIDEADFTICHEIGHIEQRLCGLREIVPITETGSIEWLGFCKTINSTFSDCLVNSDLKKRGFKLKVFKNHLYDSVLSDSKNVQKFIRNHPSLLPRFALRICAALLNLEAEKIKMIKKLLIENKAWYVFKKGQEIYNLSEEFEFDTHEKYETLIIKIIELFNLNDVVAFSQLSREEANH
jgi:hypothetical protein